MMFVRECSGIVQEWHSPVKPAVYFEVIPVRGFEVPVGVDLRGRLQYGFEDFQVSLLTGAIIRNVR